MTRGTLWDKYTQTNVTMSSANSECEDLLDLTRAVDNPDDWVGKLYVEGDDAYIRELRFPSLDKAVEIWESWSTDLNDLKVFDPFDVDAASRVPTPVGDPDPDSASGPASEPSGHSLTAEEEQIIQAEAASEPAWWGISTRCGYDRLQSLMSEDRSIHQKLDIASLAAQETERALHRLDHVWKVERPERYALVLRILTVLRWQLARAGANPAKLANNTLQAYCSAVSDPRLRIQDQAVLILQPLMLLGRRFSERPATEAVIDISTTMSHVCNVLNLVFEGYDADFEAKYKLNEKYPCG